ncbi:MAG: S1 RNA-binding domain-containing protein [Atribacterota bacterium]|nr:S1 RNA-binding domain-containing protein [Atribacterota bacterium]MDD4896745.1 S1 RNA-binding domain-containing protein [Atribacterota bacterium]MDD5637922.1 S1 RNA-binding domain-containing protein [Atribacterota bacterium]
MEKQNDIAEEKKESQSQEQMDLMMNDSLNGFKQIRKGGIIRGKVVKVDEEGYLVDIKYKMEGFLPATEDSLLRVGHDKVNHTLEVDDEIDVYVVQVDEKNGQIYLSRERARYILLWDQLINAYKTKKPIQGEVIEKNPNGLIVDLGVKAFVPLSQVEQKFITEKDLEKYIGKKLSFFILKLDKIKNNLVLSHRLALEKERESLRQKTLTNLKVGQVLTGKVVNITDFGAFVDIGGIEGLLHISEITWKEIKDPLKLIQKGDEIKVKVIDFDKDQNKISLSIKQLNPNPWEVVEEKYSIGDEVEGKVISIKDFGAFIELEEGLNGLLHISDMSWAYTRAPHEVLSEDEVIKVRILDIDKEKKKVSLGLKQLMEDPWTNIEEKYAVGNTVEGKITQVTSYGANIELEPGVSGIIHLSEIDWKYIEKPSSILKKYAILPLKVIKIDRKDRLIFLSRKQTLPNPWQNIETKYKVNNKVNGEVRRLKNFGAFISLDEEIEGFLPFSEITWEEIKHPNQVLKKGDQLELKIIEIDSEKAQITLSRKRLLANPWIEIRKKYGVGTIVEGKVVNITDFGAFVNIEENIDGLVPLSEISNHRIDKVDSVLAIGDTVQTLVTKVDDRRKKISLSIKRAEKEVQKRLIKDYNKKEGNDRILFKDIFGDVLNFKKK